jgi:hypothetical protein
MSKYYKVNPEIWENGWYYDYRLKDAFPHIQKDKVYQCFSLLWVETPNQLLRVVDDLGGSSYIPSEFMIPIDILRDKVIDEIINND